MTMTNGENMKQGVPVYVLDEAANSRVFLGRFPLAELDSLVDAFMPNRWGLNINQQPRQVSGEFFIDGLIAGFQIIASSEP